LSYTGETTDGLLLGFDEMGLNMTVRLLVTELEERASDETGWNMSHPKRPRDWAKANSIEDTARSLPKKPWSVASGGKINFEQRFQPDPPFAKMVLYFKAGEPYAGFLGFYRYDPSMTLAHPSIYVDVGQSILRTENPALLRM